MFKKPSKDPFPYDQNGKADGSIHSLPVNVCSYNPLEEIKNTLPKEVANKNEIYIAENAKIEGSLSFDQLAQIDGHFTGEILSKGKIIIGSHAHVCADLFLEEAIISGTVEGNITVTKKLTLNPPAKISGDITAPCISIAEGVSIRGQLHVMQSCEHEDCDPLSFDEGSFE